MTSPERIKPSQLYRIAEEVFGSPLERLGFERWGKRSWVRSEKAPIREVISLRAGTWAMSPVWGFSLDYVPAVSHHNNSQVFWREEGRPCGFDLGYDPIDFDRDWTERWAIRLLYGEANVRLSASVVSANTLEMALPFFDTVHKMKDLPDAYEAARVRKDIRHSFDVYADWHLAYALTLAKIGQIESGREWLKTWRSEYHLLPRRSWHQVSEYFDQIASGIQETHS